MKKRYLKKKRIFKRIYGTALKPRLSVFRSNKHFYAQLIDDINHVSLLSISTNSVDYKKPFHLNCNITSKLGSDFYEKIISSKITEKVVFDKNKKPYHGRIKAFAEALREKGLQF
jgi:large subunit ribosomal protein L18